MKKIISLFERNYETDRLVRNEVVPGAEWVMEGEGAATRKWDGTSCLFQGGQWFKRYDAKHGKKPPENFIPAQDAPDEVTGHWPGWVPVGENDYWHKEAINYDIEFTLCDDGVFRRLVGFKDGTYELIGPKVQGNPEKAPHHMLVRHGNRAAVGLHTKESRTFEFIKNYLAENDMEGIVFHHPDGLRMVKIKKKDFGFKR